LLQSLTQPHFGEAIWRNAPYLLSMRESPWDDQAEGHYP
ncbi:hypothetical protein C8P69_1341, partial [Phreatobacter oligotrophus]